MNPTLQIHRHAARHLLHRAGIPHRDVLDPAQKELPPLIDVLAQDLAQGHLLIARRLPDGQILFFTKP